MFRRKHLKDDQYYLGVFLGIFIATTCSLLQNNIIPICWLWQTQCNAVRAVKSHGFKPQLSHWLAVRTSLSSLTFLNISFILGEIKCLVLPFQIYVHLLTQISYILLPCMWHRVEMSYIRHEQLLMGLKFWCICIKDTLHKGNIKWEKDDITFELGTDL